MKQLKSKFIGLTAITMTVIALLSTNTTQAQDFGADVVSSYVWRGTQFGTGPHIQPWMELGSGAITGGIWGSFPTTSMGPDGDGNELDLWISADLGFMGLTLTNYSFPGGDGTYGAGTGVFDGDLEISGSASLGGVDLTVGYFTDLEALYIEAAFSAGPVDIGLGFGSDGKDAFYAGGDSGLVNMSFGGSKEIKITEEYSLPVFGSFIYNPDSEAAFLVFGMSF
jgi:hypothetical protein